MTTAVVLAACVGVGLVGIAAGLRGSEPPLDVVWTEWQRPGRPVDGAAPGSSPVDRAGAEVVRRLVDGRWAAYPRVAAVRGALAVSGVEPATFGSRLVVLAGACAVTPVVVWFALAATGRPVSVVPVALAVLVGPPLAVGALAAALLRTAAERRRHVRVVLGSFVDLVVLSLAGGVGVDGALHAASQVTPDWAAHRMAMALAAARDGGLPPWTALGALGVELGVPELEELATTVQLAGTEGARIRQSLTARGASLRRHEQAEAESAANAMTERLFLPGALLLLGFLVFIGYPAVHRILGGF